MNIVLIFLFGSSCVLYGNAMIQGSKTMLTTKNFPGFKGKQSSTQRAENAIIQDMTWGLTGDISFIDTWRNHEIQTNDLFGISRFGDSILEDIPFCKREYETYISLYHNTAPSNLLDEHPSENGTWDENHSSRRPYVSQTVSTKHSHISQTYDSKNGTLNLMEENVGSKHILIVTSIALVLFMTIAIFVRYWFSGKRRRKLLHSPVWLSWITCGNDDSFAISTEDHCARKQKSNVQTEQHLLSTELRSQLAKSLASSCNDKGTQTATFLELDISHASVRENTVQIVPTNGKNHVDADKLRKKQTSNVPVVTADVYPTQTQRGNPSVEPTYIHTWNPKFNIHRIKTVHLDWIKPSTNIKYEKTVEKHKEVQFFEADVPFAVVQHLTANDKNVKESQEQEEQAVEIYEAKRKEDFDSSRLDWNKIFGFLTSNLPPTEWKLFFNNLYNYGQHLIPLGVSIDRRLCQIEADVRVKWGGITSLIYEVFKDWKEMMGREASHLTIERVLQDMGYNSLLADFKEMMQNMPLLPEKKAVPTGYLGLQTNVCNILPYSAENDRSMNIYALHNSNTPVTNSRNLLQYHEERTRTLYNESLQLQDVASYKSLSIGPAGSERKRPSTDHETDYITDASESKRRRKNKRGKERRTSSTRRRQSTQEPKSRCGSLVKFEDFDKEAIVDLIKRFLPSENQVLKAHEFNLFMDHTVSLVIKKTGEPETVILSMLENDYLEVEKIETKRKDKVYIVYSNDTCLKLGQDEWHCLELYAEYARKRVLNRLKKQSADGFVPSKLLFIKFDGQPVLYKIQEVVEDPKIGIYDLPSTPSVGELEQRSLNDKCIGTTDDASCETNRSPGHEVVQNRNLQCLRKNKPSIEQVTELLPILLVGLVLNDFSSVQRKTVKENVDTGRNFVTYLERRYSEIIELD